MECVPDRQITPDEPADAIRHDQVYFDAWGIVSERVDERPGGGRGSADSGVGALGGADNRARRGVGRGVPLREGRQRRNDNNIATQVAYHRYHSPATVP